MNKDNKHIELVPKFRFNEFVKDGEWEEIPFGDLCKFTRGPFGGALKKEIFVKNGFAIYEQRHAIHKDFNTFRYYITENKYNELKRFSLQPDDLIMSCSGTMGKFAIIPKNAKKGVINQALLKLTVNKEYDLKFIKATLELPSNQNKLLSQSAGGAIKNVVAVAEIKKINLLIPKNPKEQQKIANTLSSLDDLLQAETERLALLNEHKKGLLQQLFPKQGEKVPQLRFEEFVGDGDWEETTLEQLADYENGKAHEKEISEKGKYKVVNSKFISSDGEVVKFSNSVNCDTKIGDILMVLSDVPNGKAIAKCFCVDKNDTYTVNQRICRITPTSVDNKFLFYILNRNSYFLSFDDGVKQTNLRKDVVLNCPLLKPTNPKEQQKIAKTLTSVDELIEAQTVKINTLQAHKKGLMQGLFPKIKN